jgi:hypothetical protein
MVGYANWFIRKSIPFNQINIIEGSYNKTKMSSIKTAVRVRPFLASEIQQHYRNSRLTFDS